MRAVIRYYLSLYRAFITANFVEASTYRLHFFLVIVMDLLFYASFILSIDIIYDHVENIGPWNESQFLLFAAFILAVDHIHMTLVSESFWNLSFEIRTGNLDFTLLKPASSIFSVFCRFVRASTLMNLPVVWGMLIYFGLQEGLSWYQWALLPLMVIFGFFMLVVIEMIISCAMFWLVEGSGINFLRMQFQEVARWPDFTYLYLARRFFTIGLPLLLVGSAPMHFLFDPLGSWPYFFAAVIALILLSFVFRWLWYKALAHYDSASS